MLLSDNFSDGNANGWSDTTNWTVVDDGGNNVYKSAGLGTHNNSLHGNVNWTDYTVKARVKLLDNATHGGIYARYQDSSHYYVLYFNGNDDLFLNRNNGSGSTKIGGILYRYQLNTWYEFKLTVRSGLIQVYINNQKLFQIHDYQNGSPLLASGKIGLFAYNSLVEFDDVEVTQESNYSLPVLATPTFNNTLYRKGISLNGNWDFKPGDGTWTTLRVPDVWMGAAGYTETTTATYKTTFDVPSNFSNNIFLEFEAANDKSTIKINGDVLSTHNHKDVKFLVDISDKVSPGSVNAELEVVCEQADSNNVQGWRRDGERNLGLRGNVWLKSFPDVRVEDVYIRPSTRNDEIEFEYLITNSTANDKTITIEPVAYDKAGSIAQKSFAFEGAVVNAGQTKTVTFTRSWIDYTIWQPDNPYLYLLKTKIQESVTTHDVQEEKFGFREFWRQGTEFKLNGISCRQRGDSIVDHGCRIKNVIYADCVDLQQEAYYDYFFDKSNLETLVDRIKGLNFNSVRTHMGPAPDLFYEVCDEKGLLVTCESAMYQGYSAGPNLDINAVQWVKEFVATFKNHPSVVIWAGPNEGDLTTWNYGSIESTFRVEDPTRPVIFEHVNRSAPHTEDAEILHYTHPSKNLNHDNPELPLDLYGLSGPNTKVKGEGEFFWCYNYSGHNPGAAWDAWREKLNGQGIYTRAFRYAGYHYMRPYRMNWAWKWNWNNNGWDLNEQQDRLKKSMSPVAVYDKNYDDLWDNSLTPPSNPQINETSIYNRTLIIYNDEHSGGTSITVNWYLKEGGTTHDSGSFTETVNYGQKVEKSISINTPSVSNDTAVTLVLEAYKGASLKYSDDSSYEFKVINGTTSTIIINDGDANYNDSNDWSISSFSGGYSSDYRHDGNTGSTGGKWAVWGQNSGLFNGTYKIYLFWKAYSNRATNAKVRIYHKNGTQNNASGKYDDYEVDQTQGDQLTGDWHQITTNTFELESDDYVGLLNDNANGYVIADAVKWEKQ